MKNIYIYNDAGVCSKSLQACIVLFEKLFEDAVLKVINAQQVISGQWIRDCNVFVMPGGRDLPYCQKLDGAGNSVIKKYVQQGGTYLGICAGAYYASSYVNFSKNTEIEVMGSRELGFFPGTAEGPLIPYDYNSEVGACYADIECLQSHKVLNVYYNGGCQFKAPEQFSSVKVLANYQSLASGKAAIIKCLYGKGQAILSGVHIEYTNPNKIRPFIEAELF